MPTLVKLADCVQHIRIIVVKMKKSLPKQFDGLMDKLSINFL